MLCPLPFTTFASIADFGLELLVYCPKCFAARRLNPLADATRDRQFAGARFICHRCGSRGLAQLQPPNQLIAGGPVTLLFIWCNDCLWEANALPIDEPPWSATRKGGFVCPGCRKLVRGRVVEPQGPGGLRPAELPRSPSA